MDDIEFKYDIVENEISFHLWKKFLSISKKEWFMYATMKTPGYMIGALNAIYWEMILDTTWNGSYE